MVCFCLESRGYLCSQVLEGRGSDFLCLAKIRLHRLLTETVFWPEEVGSCADAADAAVVFYCL